MSGPSGPRRPRGSTRSSTPWTVRGSGWSRSPPADERPALDAVHDPALVEFLGTAAERWAAGPYEDLVGQDRVVPYLFPTPAMTAGLPARPAVAVHADAGRFAYDTMTLVGPGTFAAVLAAVDCAAAAAELVSSGASRWRTRCPGRPATTPPPPASAAPATSTTPRSPPRCCAPAAPRRVGIVDIDAHQGNGTAAIFYDRARRALRLGARRPGRRLVPARRRVRRRDRHRRRRGRHPQPPAARGHR